MLLLEIILLIIGFAAVILSVKLSGYGTGDIHDEQIDIEAIQSLQNIKEITDQLDEKKEEIIQAASDELSRISNEKIMGMDEYSRQVLDRMEKNHEEVVFLYNMLNEKEEEIKSLVHHIDTVKAQLHEEVSKEYQSISDAVVKLRASRENISFADKSYTDKSYTDKSYTDKSYTDKSYMDLEEQKITETPIENRKTERYSGDQEKEMLHAVYDQEIEAIEQAEKEEQKYFQKKSEQEEKKSVQQNHNNEIISLFKKGHSILEISRMLSLGQGEVKFVIDLYEAR